jgi:hypothetical protein
MASKPRKTAAQKEAEAAAKTNVGAEVEVPAEAAPKKGDSPEKAKYRKLIAAYAAQNPAKYALKEKALLARLEAIK